MSTKQPLLFVVIVLAAAVAVANAQFGRDPAEGQDLHGQKFKDGLTRQHVPFSADGKSLLRVEYRVDGPHLKNTDEEFGNFGQAPLVNDYVTGKSGCEYRVTRRHFRMEPSAQGRCKLVITLDAMADLYGNSK